MKGDIIVGNVAVVLIDLQNAIIEGLSFDQRNKLKNYCNELLVAARQKNIPIFWVTVTKRPDGKDTSSAITDAPSNANKLSLEEGTKNSAIAEGLLPEPSDYFINKHGRSAFIGTDLERQLRRLGCNTLLLGGVATNWGVESTARDAHELDYNVVFVREICAGFDEKMHIFAMNRIFPSLGRLRTVDETIQLLPTGNNTP